MVIQHNIPALFTSNQLSINDKNKAKTTERLSSGYKINRSADDAAGLTISENMRWMVRGLNKGSQNTQDGISLLQVADGALNEVHDMLHRLKELSVQAANDVNTDTDRAALKSEMDEICKEIDRIGDTTEFNTQKLFKGGYKNLVNSSGSPVNVDDLAYSDFTIADVDLLGNVFSSGSTGRVLQLAAGTTAASYEGSSASGIKWNLIYGNGNTSHSNFEVSYVDDAGNTVKETAKLENMTISGYNYDSSTKTYERTFSYDNGTGVKFDIKQSVSLDDKYYGLNYKIDNTGTKDANIRFLFNSDSAYNNNDSCESYYIAGNKVSDFTLFTDDTSYTGYTNIKPLAGSDLASQKSFTIVDTDEALPFAVNIKWSETPSAVLIGPYGKQTGDWEFFDNLNSNLSGSTNHRDIAFSLIWNKSIAQGASETISLNYGISETKTDPNLKDVPIKYISDARIPTDEKELWIQSGATKGSGMNITIGAMNCNILGINGLDVSSNSRAGNSIRLIDEATQKLSDQRSHIGAQQNRLEYARTIDDITAENTQSAESKIRDADMAEEMMKLSTHNILTQASQAMLSQANRSAEGILSLLQ